MSHTGWMVQSHCAGIEESTKRAQAWSQLSFCDWDKKHYLRFCVGYTVACWIHPSSQNKSNKITWGRYPLKQCMPKSWRIKSTPLVSEVPESSSNLVPFYHHSPPTSMIAQNTLMITAGYRVMAFLHRQGKSNQRVYCSQHSSCRSNSLLNELH